MTETAQNTPEFVRKVLECSGKTALRITGCSMTPLLRPNTHVVLRPLLSQETLHRKIVALQLGKRLVVHYVTHTAPGIIKTKGVRSKNTDGWSPLSDIVGIVTQISSSPSLSEKQIKHLTWCSNEGNRILRYCTSLITNL